MNNLQPGQGRRSVNWISTVCAVLIVAGCTPVARATGRSPVSDFRLKNGLRVLLRPLQGARQSALVVLFNVGGNHDPKGKSGLAHLVEHLYVTAAAGSTPARTAEEWATAFPGNAQTGEDYTVVAETFPSANLTERIADAAARMGGLRIEQSDLDRERHRLLQEVSNMFGAMPSLAAFNLARERSRPSPFGGRRGGLPAHVETLSLADVRGHWKRYYKPRNALIVLVGDFKAEDAKPAIERAFGALPTGDAAPPAAAPGKSLPGLEKVEVAANVPGSDRVLTAMYSAPAVGSKNYPAFLAFITRMVSRSQTLGGAAQFPPPVYYAVLDGPETLAVTTQLKRDETPEQAVLRLDQFVARETGAPWRAEEARTVQSLYGAFLGVTAMPDGQWAQNPYGLAFSLGRRIQLGIDPVKLRTELEALDGKALQEAATLLAPERRSAVLVIPRGDST